MTNRNTRNSKYLFHFVSNISKRLGVFNDFFGLDVFRLGIRGRVFNVTHFNINFYSHKKSFNLRN